jgi:uncharacterized membrane-anchored protein
MTTQSIQHLVPDTTILVGLLADLERAVESDEDAIRYWHDEVDRPPEDPEGRKQLNRIFTHHARVYQQRELVVRLLEAAMR